MFNMTNDRNNHQAHNETQFSICLAKIEIYDNTKRKIYAPRESFALLMKSMI